MNLFQRCFISKAILVLLFAQFHLSKTFAQINIISFSPLAGPVGTIVTINGSGFAALPAGNTVYFGAVQAAVLTATQTVLTVKVPPGASYQSIIVTAGGLTAFSAQSFLLTYPACSLFNERSFFPRADQNVNTTPGSTTGTDIDGDGKADLVSVSGGLLTIYRNTGSGGPISFDAGISISFNGNSTQVATGDVNGDGKPDILVALNSSSLVSIYINASVPGTVALLPNTDFPTGSNPVSITLGEIDGDGRPDIVTCGSQRSISVLRNTSLAGTVSFAVKTDISTGLLTPRGLGIADFDKDGKVDIAVAATNATLDSVLVFQNSSDPGSISFLSHTGLVNGKGGYAMAAGDIDGDGYTDIAVANNYANSVSLFRNSGSAGTIGFAAKLDIVVGSSPQSIAISNVNGDSNPDIVVGNSSSSNITVLAGSGAAGALSFYPKQDLSAGYLVNNVLASDFSGDGRTDIIAVSQFPGSFTSYRASGSSEIFLVDVSKINNTTPLGLCSVTTADWQNACSDLQAVMNVARQDDQIWIAKGTLYPTADISGNLNPADAATKTFAVKNGVHIYGGFAGMETTAAQRLPGTAATILSGGPSAAQADYNVLYFANTDSSTIIENITVTNGQAGSHHGGGISMELSMARIFNCIITGNTSQSSGAGIYLSNSSPVFVNCNIVNNTAPNAAAMENDHAFPTLVNCTIAANISATGNATIVNENGAAPVLTNCILWANGYGGLAQNNISPANTATISYSIVGQDAGAYPGLKNANINPLFLDGAAGNFKFVTEAPLLKLGNPSAYPAWAPATDLGGNQRLLTGLIGMGAYQQGADPIVNANGIIYTNKNVQQLLGNGSSWTGAYPELADAVTMSNASDRINQIWAAEGTYHPFTDSTGNPNSGSVNQLSFFIHRGVSLYGGFAGNETSIAQRISGAHPTILDGLININGTNEKVGSVIYISHTSRQTNVDGFSIINGGGGLLAGGGGLQIYNASVNLNNLIVSDNLTSGILVLYSTVRITQCEFTANRGINGMALSLFGSTVHVDRTSFHDNDPGPINSYNFYNQGGAIFSTTSDVTVTNSRFFGILRRTMVVSFIMPDLFSVPPIASLRVMRSVLTEMPRCCGVMARQY